MLNVSPMFPGNSINNIELYLTGRVYLRICACRHFVPASWYCLLAACFAHFRNQKHILFLRPCVYEGGIDWRYSILPGCSCIRHFPFLLVRNCHCHFPQWSFARCVRKWCLLYHSGWRYVTVECLLCRSLWNLPPQDIRYPSISRVHYMIVCTLRATATKKLYHTKSISYTKN